MSYEDDNESGSDGDFGDLFGSEDEASDIDDGRSQSSQETSPQQATESPPQAPLQQKTKSNDLDNLFGSDDESRSDEEEETNKRQTLKQRSRIESSEDEHMKSSPTRGRNRYDYDDDEEEERAEGDYAQSSQKQRVEVSLQMPQLPLPYSDNDEFYLAKLARFLNYEETPFNHDDFEIIVKRGLTALQEQEAIREQIENTIRWRQAINEKGIEYMESNAHIVEWEDGKRSLMLGQECFDIGTKKVGTDDHSFLLAHQTDSGALESQTEFTNLMAFMPSGLQSDTHRHLTAQIAHKEVKKNKTKMYFTEKDPELMKQEIESQENEKLKAQKKLELARRKVDMRYGDVGTSRRHNEFGDFDTTTDYTSTRNAFNSSAQDEYEDDFVVNDDEYDEEEERSREDRLSQVKKAGMDKYTKRSRYSEEEEEEEEEDEGVEENNDYGNDEEEEEEIVIRRHKRSRLLSDEEDE